MGASSIALLNNGSLPPSISGGTLPPAISQDPRVQAAQQQASQANAQVDDIQARNTTKMAPINADIAQKTENLGQMAQAGPEQQALPQNNAKHIDSKQLSDSFSAFMTLGALAGLLSKTPMTAALNNMTGAIKGVQEGDEEQYKRQYQEFTQNYQKAVDANKAKLDEYNRIFANSKVSLDEKIREAGLVAAKYGDELVRAETRRNQNYKGVQEAIDAATKAQEHAADKKQELDHWHQEHLDRMAELQARKEAQENGGKGTLSYKLAELDSLKASGSVTQQEYDDKRKGLIEGMAGPRIGEERSFGQATPLILANKELTDLQNKGTQMPFAGDIHIDSGGIASAAGRFGIRRELTDQEQQIITAAQLYAESAGHIQSGARLTQSAFDRVIREFIPMKLDKPGNLQEKKDHRDALENSARVMSGKLGSQLTPHETTAHTYADSEKESRYQKWKAEHAAQ